MKKVKINLLAIIGLMVAVATVAFTAPRTNLFAETEWYEIAEPDSMNPADDELGAFTTDPTQGAECSALTVATRCAVEVENPNNFNLEGEILSDAMALDPDIKIKSHTYWLQ